MKLGLEDEANYLFNFGIKVGKMDGFIRINGETIYNQKLVGSRDNVVKPIYYYVEDTKNFNFDMKFNASDNNKVDIFHGTITKINNGMNKNLLNIRVKHNGKSLIKMDYSGNYLVILRYVYQKNTNPDEANINFNGIDYKLTLTGGLNNNNVNSINIYLDDIKFVNYTLDNSANMISDVYLSIIPLNFTLDNKMSRKLELSQIMLVLIKVILIKYLI